MKKILINLTSIFLFSLLLIPLISHGQTITNPLKSDSLIGTVKSFLNVVIEIGSVICIMFLIYAGYLFVDARGNPGEITKAKDTFKWTIIGIVILLGSQLIANIVTGTINNVAK
ncbi:MAG: hypothetical protein WC631_01650 [Candidatus Paceibacterota bacterium]|jgi:hypothetical protein